MSRLKLIHGVSRIRRAKLQSSIDQTVADDIELLAQWSNNETNYVINELLPLCTGSGRRLPEIQDDCGAELRAANQQSKGSAGTDQDRSRRSD